MWPARNGPARTLTVVAVAAIEKEAAHAHLFGSGYVLLAFLRSELVVQLGWLSEAQLLDAVAVGQTTPGLIFTTATFIGYVLGGHAGALAATVGIFLPALLAVGSAVLLFRCRVNSSWLVTAGAAAGLLADRFR